MPWFVTAFGAIVAALGISIAIVFGFGINQAFAATAWTGGTFTYGGQTYPTSLCGVTVTFKAVPGSPADYMGRSGGNIMWYEGRYYPVGAFVEGSGFADYWMSETFSTATNPWYITLCNNQSYNMWRTYYDANHGWGGGRTVTFASGGTLGSNEALSDCPILYLYDFIRYVVDNSDFRTRYTIGSTPSPTWSNATVTYDNLNHRLEWSVPTTNPSFVVQIYYSSNDANYQLVQAYSNNNYTGSYVLPSQGYYYVVFKSTLNAGGVVYQTSTATQYTWLNPWTAVDVTYSDGALSWSIPSPLGYDVAVTIQYSLTGEDGTWSNVLQLLQAPVSYLFEPVVSGFYRVIFQTPEDARLNASRSFQTYNSPYIPVTVNDNPSYMSFLYDPSARKLTVAFDHNAAQPTAVTLQYSRDGVTWYDFGTDYAIEAGTSIAAGLTWEAVFEYLPEIVYLYRLLVVPSYETYNIGELGTGSGNIIVPEDSPSWMQNIVQWLQDFLGNMQPFFDALLGWMPADFRSVFFTLVTIGLLIGFITIIRG